LPKAICNTSPLQYLHQLGLLHLLPALLGRIVVPLAVANELAVGQASGIDVPDMRTLDRIEIRSPAHPPASPLSHDLGPGESAVLAIVLAIALEVTDPLVILDDLLARQEATALNLPVRGTLGVLLDAKRQGIIPAVAPILDQLDTLRFRVSALTRKAVLDQAGE
jgi:hypothetical protein